ncbi:MAG TPA: chorismate-binding protein [Candidatus Krumholzibacteria bacterium]|nr:chorismate-binding protein [Candidatus Krumholzibacteria bacterium]
MNHAVLRDAATGRWLEFTAPRAIIAAHAVADVRPALRAVEDAVERRGLHAAGFVGYEAAPAFDTAFEVRPAGRLPLLWFGLFDAPRVRDIAPLPPGSGAAREWLAAIGRDEYDRAFARIKALIARGDTYQVNYTFRLRAALAAEDAWDFFVRHMALRAPEFGAFIALPGWTVCGASPELFFRLDGDRLESRPMKGTRPRGRFRAEDDARAAELLASEKDRAENVMIVDMVRNDMGRVARTGSVVTPHLFAIERHPTVLQMTSTVRGETRAPLSDIFAAMFPAASITGAPKARSMQIIAALESSPRQVYTGAVGFIAPGRRAQFNVAIRTALVDHAAGAAEFGIGGGIVWDSRVDDEYAESGVKAGLLREPPREFDLIETLLWLPEAGYPLRERHLARIAESAAFFGRPLDADRVRTELDTLAAAFAPVPQRVRVSVAADGAVRCEAAPLAAAPERPRRVAVARGPVDSTDAFLLHKTTARDVYRAALASRPGCDDVVLYNERGEVTETTIANLVVEVDGVRATPPVVCGLLPGVQRARLLEDGVVCERVITLAELLASPRVWLVNSVRGMWEVDVVAAETPTPA